MKLAIMQPYVFPYLVYFQLLSMVDKFIMLDDVMYKKKGFINRNNILLNGKSYRFSVPVARASQNVSIFNTLVSYNDDWNYKLIKTIEQSYSNAPYFKSFFPILKTFFQMRYSTISELSKASIYLVCDYLGLKVEIINSSKKYTNNHLKGSARIIDICKKEHADTYLNLPGGRLLYSEQKFLQEGIQLFFVTTKPVKYMQFHEPFIENLSIIDALMFNSIQNANVMLKKCFLT
jgi:hypothetical protein